jgi:DNA-binding GntR family transcriptional regulator
MKKLTTVRSTLKSEEIASELRRRIFLNLLKDGEKLTQDSIASEFGSSHIPVREAFRMLASEGLVEQRPNRGVVVSTLDPSFVEELLEIRGVLEVQALRWAMPRIDSQAVALAEKILRKSEQTDDVDVWLACNWEFHAIIYELSGRPTLHTILNSLNSRIERVIRVLIANTDYRHQAEAEHRALLASLTVNNEAAAELLLDQHLKETKKGLVELIKNLGST